MLSPCAATACPLHLYTHNRTWSPAKFRAGLLCRALPGSRKPAAAGPYMDAGVPARPCGRAVWLTTLLALSSLGDTGWWGWPRGEAGCTAVDMRLLLGLCSRPPRAGRQFSAAAGLSSAECEHSTARHVMQRSRGAGQGEHMVYRRSNPRRCHVGNTSMPQSVCSRRIGNPTRQGILLLQGDCITLQRGATGQHSTLAMVLKTPYLSPTIPLRSRQSRLFL